MICEKLHIIHYSKTSKIRTAGFSKSLLSLSGGTESTSFNKNILKVEPLVLLSTKFTATSKSG